MNGKEKQEIKKIIHQELVPLKNKIQNMHDDILIIKTKMNTFNEIYAKKTDVANISGKIAVIISITIAIATALITYGIK